ncbi:helix-turn-helix domain-containing protein [Amycolatopsis japonica]
MLYIASCCGYAGQRVQAYKLQSAAPMNTAGSGDRVIDPALWDDPVMRRALHGRDIGAVFALLKRHGVSQRRISALTGQSQSEVSEIVNGRQVMAYDVLQRIAAGLGVPRGLMGLAYTPDTEVSAALSASPRAAQEVTPVPDRREFLGVLAKIAVGAALTTADLAFLSTPAQATPTPTRVGETELRQVQELTRMLWVQEKALGGGAVREAALSQLAWVRALLRASHTDQITHELYIVLADLSSLAGWASHDMAMPGDALRHLLHSMAAASEAGDPMRAALAMEQVARVHLQLEQPGEALKTLQLGALSADRSGNPQARAQLLATTARTYADLGQIPHALDALTKAQDALASSPSTPAGGSDLVIPEPRGFDHAALDSDTGRVLAIAARVDRTHAPRAVSALAAYNATADTVRLKRRSISSAQLSTVLFHTGQTADAVAAGRAALGLASSIRSARVLDHLDAVRAEARRLPRHPDAADLARDIAAMRASSPT